jgi:hypothetical protein
MPFLEVTGENVRKIYSLIFRRYHLEEPEISSIIIPWNQLGKPVLKLLVEPEKSIA